MKLKGTHKGQKQKDLDLGNHTRLEMTEDSTYLELICLSDNIYDECWFFEVLPPNNFSHNRKPIRIFQRRVSLALRMVGVESID